jgi:hypothetical protein
MATKDWRERTVSEFQSRNRAIRIWRHKKHSHKEVTIIRDSNGDFDVVTPTSRLNVYPNKMSRALVVARAYMRSH